MDVVTGVELECSYGAGDGRTRSRVASMPKERSGGPRLDQSCDWEKYGYDRHVRYHVVVQCRIPLKLPEHIESRLLQWRADRSAPGRAVCQQ